MEPLELDRHARRHHGLVVRHRCALPTATWYRWIAAGRLEQIHPGVARMPGADLSEPSRIAAAVWATGRSTLASHRSAAFLHDLIDEDEVVGSPVDLIVRHRSHRGRLDGVVVHRPIDQQRLAPTVRSGIPCTDLLRSLVDLGAVAPSLVHRAVGRALSARRVDLAALDAVVESHGKRGRSGIGPLRHAIEHWTIDAKPADSVLEVAFARLVSEHGLPAFDFHPVIEGWEVDFRMTGSNVIVECDGWTTHGLDRSQFERDRRRDDDLAAAGWVVRRFSYRAIVDSPADTARRIRRAIAASPG